MGTIHYDSDQQTVQGIINLYQNGQLNLEPGFQRSSVWSERDRQKLIDSILRNYPLPSIFLYRNRQDGDLVYDVIDGKQRIESILMFTGEMWGERFWVKSSLTPEEPSDWIDWSFIRRRKSQHLITAYKLQVIEVEGELGDIIDLFVRINSTGKALTGAEKRHARYFNSDFLKKADKLANRYLDYFLKAEILTPSQISRMKHVELICELLVSANRQDVINKKAALDHAMKANSISGRDLEKAAQATVTALNRLSHAFPRLYQTRFKQLSDFYTLAVLFQKFEREGRILTDHRRNRLAWDLLVAFSNRIDQARLLMKKGKALMSGHETEREYVLTILEGTDAAANRRAREEIVRQLLESLFESKASARLFSAEQRRILWNSTAVRKCRTCPKTLTWEDFTIHHIHPYSKGGRTELDNAAIMCRRCNSAKGNR
jgi:5-methylcytosine-specific restriction endonuclease McrA